MSTANDAALEYASWGWSILPVHWIADGACSCGDPTCRTPGKHPLTPRGLHDASTDRATISAWWSRWPSANVAIRTGSGLVVIDVDPRHGGDATLAAWCAEHGPLPDTIEALTGGGGRHLYLTTPAEEHVPSRVNVLGLGVDVRGEGGYVLAPPSGHLSGGVYQWEATSDPHDGAPPAEIPAALLAALRAPKPSTEPTEQVALLPAEKVAEIRSALTVVDADDRDTWLRVGMALHSTRSGRQAYGLWTEWSQTSEKYNATDQRRTWRSFKPDHGITLSTLFGYAKAEGWTEPVVPSVEVIEDEDNNDLDEPPDPALPPPELLTVPGVLGEFVRWSGETAPQHQPQFDVQAALALGSVVLGRMWCTDRQNYSSLYFLNVGPTGSGKEHAKTCLDRVLADSDHSELINGTGYTSPGAVFSALRERPCHLTIIDEIGRWLESANTHGNFIRQDTLTTIMEAFGRVAGMMQPPTYSSMGLSAAQRQTIVHEPIWYPAITLLGLTTPDTFFSALTSHAVKNGFLNRFVIVQSTLGRVLGQDIARIDPPTVIAEWVRTVRAPRGNLPQIGPLRPEPRVVTMSKESIDLFQELRVSIHNRQRFMRDGLDDLLTRTREVAMRLSLIVAVSRDPGCSEIVADDARWAICYASHYADAAITAVSACVADSAIEATHQKFLAGFRATKRWLSLRDMANKRPWKSHPSRERDEALTHLVLAGTVEKRVVSTGKAGRPKTVYRAVKQN